MSNYRGNNNLSVKMGHRKSSDLTDTSYTLLRPVIDELNEAAGWKDLIEAASKVTRYRLRSVKLVHDNFRQP